MRKQHNKKSDPRKRCTGCGRLLSAYQEKNHVCPGGADSLVERMKQPACGGIAVMQLAEKFNTKR